jgi:hypothetical protein
MMSAPYWSRTEAAQTAELHAMMKRPLPKKGPLPKVPPPQKKPVVVKPKPEVAKGPVSSIGAIFSTAWMMYKKRALPILAVMLLAILFSILLLAALGIGGIFALGLDPQQLQQQFVASDFQQLAANPAALSSHPLFPFLLGGGTILLLVVILLGIWQQTAMLAAAVDEHHGVMESLCTGWKYLFPMLWISTLYSGIVLSGLCLLILPGLILALSMSLYLIVMLDEQRTGLDALMASRLYIRGHWWDTLIKMLLIGFLMTVVGIVPFLPLLFAPFALLYMVAVYRDLKQAAGTIDTDSTCRCLWMPMALAGMLLPILAALGAVVMVGPKLPVKLEEIRENVLQQLGQAAEKQGMTLKLPKADGQPLPDDGTSEPVSKTPEVKILPSIDGFIIWRDPVGDVGNPLLDIREVTAIGKQGELVLTVTLAKPFAEYFAAKDRETFNPLVNFYFDVDMKQTTGTVLASDKGRGGYDLDLDVLLTAPKNSPESTGQAYVSLYDIGPQKRQSLAPLADNVATIADNTLTIHLPYARIDAAVGGKLKVCFREASQKEGSGVSNDQTIPLK